MGTDAAGRYRLPSGRYGRHAHQPVAPYRREDAQSLVQRHRRTRLPLQTDDLGIVDALLYKP